MQHDESELLDARSHADATARSTVVRAMEGLESAADWQRYWACWRQRRGAGDVS